MMLLLPAVRFRDLLGLSEVKKRDALCLANGGLERVVRYSYPIRQSSAFLQLICE